MKKYISLIAISFLFVGFVAYATVKTKQTEILNQNKPVVENIEIPSNGVSVLPINLTKNIPRGKTTSPTVQTPDIIIDNGNTPENTIPTVEEPVTKVPVQKIYTDDEKQYYENNDYEREDD